MNKKEKPISKALFKEYVRLYTHNEITNCDLNEEKCDNMNFIIAYCQSLEKERGCKILRCDIKEGNKQCYIEVMFEGNSIFSKENGQITDFVNALNASDGVNISTTPANDEWIVVTFFVNDMWIQKE